MEDDEQMEVMLYVAFGLTFSFRILELAESFFEVVLEEELRVVVEVEVEVWRGRKGRLCFSLHSFCF